MAGTEDQQIIVYRGISQISRTVGINPKRFAHYQKKLGLPVFKIDAESNVWLACHDDLMRWVDQRKKKWEERR